MIIDADAHVEESEAMFDRLDKSPGRAGRCQKLKIKVKDATR